MCQGEVPQIRREAASISAEEKDLAETISVVQNAVGPVQKEMSEAGGVTSVQVQRAASVVRVVQARLIASTYCSVDVREDMLDKASERTDRGAAEPDREMLTVSSMRVVDTNGAISSSVMSSTKAGDQRCASQRSREQRHVADGRDRVI